MEGLINAMIENRMKSQGFNAWNIKTETIILTNTNAVNLKRQNKTMFLIDVDNIDNDIVFQSDNKIFKLSDINYAGLPVTSESITGEVIIKKLTHTAPTTLLFITVVPKY